MYFAVNGRIAVDLEELDLDLTKDEFLQILEKIGFFELNVDLTKEATKMISIASYRRGAKPSEAPKVFDCSSLCKYLLGLKGIWIPRRSIQQREFGRSVEIEEAEEGDLIFCSGAIDYYFNNPSDGVGHVGMITNRNTVVHAANSKVGVIESDLEVFFKNNEFRGMREFYYPETITIKIPENRLVETSDDLRWIILQNI